MSHDVVTPLLLLDGGDLELLRVEMLAHAHESLVLARGGAWETYEVRLHLLDGVVRDGEAELLFGYGEVEPQLPPCVEAVLRGMN